MRIGLDYRPALQNREGIGRYARELVRAFVALGVEDGLALFGSTWAPMRYSREELGLAGSRANLSRVRLPSKWLPKLLGAFGRGADDFLGDIELFHHTQPNVLPIRRAIEVATIFDCIYTKVDEGFVEAASAERMTRAVRELIRRSRLVLAPTEFVRGELARTFAIARERIAVTRLGCDHIVRDRPPNGFVRPTEPYLLTVSRVDPRKNHLRMLRAFEKLVRDGSKHRWVVAGPRGWRVEEFEHALADSPARDRIDWREFVPDAAMPALYSNADALVFASFAEGFGLPPLEAMACGTPVVTSNASSLPEICGDAALFVDPNDVDSIFDATRRVLSDRELAKSLCARGLERAKLYTWKHCAEETLAAYESALTNRA